MQASEIVAALRANEADAPAELFDAYGEQLIAYCWQQLRSEDATLIAVRDTLIVAQEHIGRLRDPELIEPWLLALGRDECERRARAAAGHAAKAANAARAGNAGDATPAPAAMRDEILACLTDPRQARYRAVAATRVASLDASGFPAGAAASRTVRRPRWHRAARRVAAPDATGLPAGAAARPAGWRPRGGHLHLGGGLLTAGAASSAVVILLVAGFSLRGAAAPAAPAASASSPAVAQGGPALANSATPQERPVAVTSPVPSLPVSTPGESTTQQTQQALYDISSQPGASGRVQNASQHGGQTPPVPRGMPPVPATSAPPAAPAPFTDPPWAQRYRRWTPPSTPPAPGGGPTSSPATSAPSPASPWSPAPWPTRPQWRTAPRPSATRPDSTSPTATMAAAEPPPDPPATTKKPAAAASPAPAAASPGTPGGGYPGRSGRHGRGGHWGR